MKENWHTMIMRRVKNRTDAELAFSRKDLREVIEAQESLIKAGCSTPKYGEYVDELHYVNMEINRRERSMG